MPYEPKIYKDEGGDRQVIAAGGTITTTGEYSGTGSYQPVAPDLSLAAGAGSATSSSPKFLAAVMGNVIGDALTKVSNYIGGVIAHFTVTGTKATTYPAGAVLAGIGDGVTEADGAVVAYIDGDSAQTNAEAAFKVMNNNTVPGSGFAFGLDLSDATRDGFPAVAYTTADIRLANGLHVVGLATAITANVTTTTAPAGSIGITSHATGRGSIFISDGSKWQFPVVS